MEKREPLYTIRGNVNWGSHYGNSMEIPQKIKNRTTIGSNNSTPGYLSKERKKKKQKPLIRKEICTPIFTEALFTIAKIWKQPNCPSIDEWITKVWYIHNRILSSHKIE